MRPYLFGLVMLGFASIGSFFEAAPAIDQDPLKSDAAGSFAYAVTAVREASPVDNTVKEAEPDLAPAPGPQGAIVPPDGNQGELSPKPPAGPASAPAVKLADRFVSAPVCSPLTGCPPAAHARHTACETRAHQEVAGTAPAREGPVIKAGRRAGRVLSWLRPKNWRPGKCG